MKVLILQLCWGEQSEQWRRGCRKSLTILSDCTKERTGGRYVYGDSIISRNLGIKEWAKKQRKNRPLLFVIHILGHTSQTFQRETLKKMKESSFIWKEHMSPPSSCSMEACPHSGQMRISKSQTALFCHSHAGIEAAKPLAALKLEDKPEIARFHMAIEKPK